MNLPENLLDSIPSAMTSTSVTRMGGVVVVTQVIPHDEGSIQLQTAAPSTQAPLPATQAPPPATTKMDDMKGVFLRGEPQGLGVVQIFIGVLCLLFAVATFYSPVLYSPFYLAMAFVVSGALTLAAQRKTSVKLVKAALVWNVISVVIGLAGVAYLCWLLAVDLPAAQFCVTDAAGQSWSTEEEQKCVMKMRLLNVAVTGLRGLLLVLLVLQVCVAITASTFSFKAVRRHRCSPPFKVEAGDDSPLLPDAASGKDSDGEETPGAPSDSP